MKTSIVILTYNKLEYTIQCIESIRRFTKPHSYEMIVVDNNSTDGTQEWLLRQNDIKPILNKSNLGFPKGCNQGIEISSGEAILLLNNDTIVTKNWLNNLLVSLYSEERIGAVGCITNNSSYAQSIPENYSNLEEMQIFAEEYNQSNASEWEERLKLVGFCYLVKRSVINKVGMLDERFTPGNYEDDDLSVRIRKAGYKLLLCKDTFIYHFGSVSFGTNSDYFSNILASNAKKFEDKWGFNPNYSQGIRFDIVKMMDSPPDAAINVLEVGCACGGTLLDIKNKYKNSSLYGIELNDDAASIAALIADVRNDDIEKVALTYPDNFFDYIIFGDVLEHLYDPWKVLNYIKKHLKPNGKIIASIPNIMHYSVIDSLLKGSWSYSDSGLLDRTHIRFFTLKEIQKMFLQTGYYRLTINTKTVTNQIGEASLLNKITPYIDSELVEQLNVYQFIVCAYKHDLEETFLYALEHPQEKEILVDRLQHYSDTEIVQAILFTVIEKKVELLNCIGTSHFEMGVYERVIPFFESGYFLDDRDPDVLFNISFFLSYIGEPARAEFFMKTLREVNTDMYNELIKMLYPINDY
ncbi:glycosyltransferase [Paenibacillus sp. JNUCC32]|uniref:bifunctional glycosyltransferase family 2 protein/class I SAM-dependent methyltransferase n=1 Tax=Paenibacillus sp. JNUCC32 TaxID=2777984 RepID=UPI0017884B3C|nr:bifunctional glycosyltransferase family 2 protein/class I SAM-dependent methyltransferase [Paenibacillus sp. JNUCC-32]QOT09826.1 glycosyltransferase [Paenibacillus sp. JNUCC-32]